jgi:hypothetical protein
MQEYEEMLRDAQRAADKLLALNPQTVKFWDELTDYASLFTSVGARSESIWEEITPLVDQLPEDKKTAAFRGIPRKLRVLTFHELAGALGGTNDGFDERNAQTSLFKL